MASQSEYADDDIDDGGSANEEEPDPEPEPAQPEPAPPVAEPVVARVDWKSLRKVRWTSIYEVLREYLRTRVLPDGLTRRTKRRLVLLGDIMTYEPATGTVALYTRTARPEETDKTGKPLLPSAKPMRYTAWWRRVKWTP